MNDTFKLCCQVKHLMQEKKGNMTTLLLYLTDSVLKWHQVSIGFPTVTRLKLLASLHIN